MMKGFAVVCLLMAALPAFAAEPAVRADVDGAGSTPVAASHGLLGELESFMRQQAVDVGRLDADAAVRLMVDWYRFAPVDAAAAASARSADALVYRYGGWSEGCATAFKLSLLRRVTGRNTMDGGTEQLAGITLMFEPSGQGELMPFTTTSTDWKSIDAFLEAIQDSPAFRGLATATPMAVVLESGGLR